MRKRQFLFRLFYSTSFSILLVIEILLLLISPGDIIYQSSAANRRLSIIAVAVVYVAVFLISAFIIATRFYTAHTQFTAIPKSYVPIRKEDLSKSLQKLINSELLRSASIAYHAYPRSINEEEIQALAQENNVSKRKTIALPLDHMKSWTEIRHPGWSSPCAKDLPDLQFDPVLSEFPHLLEAKAVSLASSGNTVTNPRVAELLQRPASVSLRDYFERLEEFEMIDMTDTIGEFVKDYEQSRFSGSSTSEGDFRRMLESFTAIIQGLKPPSDEALQSFLLDFSGSSKANSRPDMISHSSKSSQNQVSRPKRSVMNKKRSEYERDDNIANTPAPLARSLRSFLATQTHAYQASLSSGHAGDRSSDSSDSESAYPRHTKQTQPTKHSQEAIQAHSESVESESRRASKSIGAAIALDHQDDGENDIGSVIRRTITGNTDRTSGSNMSRKSWGSVIWREGQGDSTLPLPIVNDLERSEI